MTPWDRSSRDTNQLLWTVINTLPQTCYFDAAAVSHLSTVKYRETFNIVAIYFLSLCQRGFQKIINTALLVADQSCGGCGVQ